MQPLEMAMEYGKLVLAGEMPIDAYQDFLTEHQLKICSRCVNRHCKWQEDLVPELKLHDCPYAFDVNGNEENVCDCCDDCQQECANDI